MQSAFLEKMSSRKSNVKFIKFNGFESIRDLENFLLVFDDSCEDVYDDKEFVRLATAVRHRGIDVLYIQHTFFFQSRWSRTIDLNTSHIILFKSPLDVQHLYLLDRHLNKSKFFKSSYKLATRDFF